MVIGLPPVLNFGKPELRDKIVPEIFAGKKASRSMSSPSHFVLTYLPL